MNRPITRIVRILAAAVVLAVLATAHAADGLRTEVGAGPPAGHVRLDLRERAGETVLVARWRHHSRPLCCRAYPARVVVRGAGGAVLHSAPVEYRPRRLRHKPHNTWVLSFEHALPAGLPSGAVVRLRHDVSG